MCPFRRSRHFASDAAAHGPAAHGTVKHQLRLGFPGVPLRTATRMLAREDLLYELKGGSLRSPPPAAGGRKRPSSPAGSSRPRGERSSTALRVGWLRRQAPRAISAPSTRSRSSHAARSVLGRRRRFGRKATAPFAPANSLHSGPSCADTRTTTGLGRSSASRLLVSNPDMSGSPTSRSTRSGRTSATNLMASSPLAASPRSSTSLRRADHLSDRRQERRLIIDAHDADPACRHVPELRHSKQP